MLSDLQKAIKADLRVQVTVWDPNNESAEYTFSSYVMEGTGLRFKIAPPDEEPTTILPLMTEGIAVGVVLDAYPAPFIFYPIIQDVPLHPAQGYWLSIPYNAEVEIFQRRRHVRIPMIVPVELEFPSIGAGANMKIPARTSDLSGGGMRFTSSRNLSGGEVLIVHLQFDAEQPMMDLTASVIFSTGNRVRKHPDDLYSTACQFLKLNDAQEMMIVRECFRCELKLKQKE
jgi:hypothetical protein